MMTVLLVVMVVGRQFEIQTMHFENKLIANSVQWILFNEILLLLNRP